MTARPPGRLIALPLFALLALPGCKREAAPDAGTANQVLPGSASDAMLPVDRLTSQPPLDPRADRGSVAASADKGSATEAAAEAAPAAAPAPEGTGAAD
jgi:hypothetical protein